MTYAYDPELAPLAEFIPVSELTDVPEARRWLDSLIAPLNDDVDTGGVTVVDRSVPGSGGPIPVRVYSPDGVAPDGGRPGLLDIHGGGFVVGSIAMEHGLAVQVAREFDIALVGFLRDDHFNIYHGGHRIQRRAPGREELRT